MPFTLPRVSYCCSCGCQGLVGEQRLPVGWLLRMVQSETRSLGTTLSGLIVVMEHTS